jgi:hypothetical protein
LPERPEWKTERYEKTCSCCTLDVREGSERQKRDKNGFHEIEYSGTPKSLPILNPALEGVADGEGTAYYGAADGEVAIWKVRGRQRGQTRHFPTDRYLRRAER